MTHEQLDDLFRRAVPGPIPNGEGDGTVIFASDEPVAEEAAKLAHLIAWKGKVFDSAAGELRNEVGPLGDLAVRAKVYREQRRSSTSRCSSRGPMRRPTETGTAPPTSRTD